MNTILGKFPPFHPQTVIRDWQNDEAFRLADALTGVCIFGATGSGKTSGPGKHLQYGYLSAGFGGLVLCAKPDECAQWVRAAIDCKRVNDVIVIDPSGNKRFNFLSWEAERPHAGGGNVINLVSIFDVVGGTIAKAAAKTEASGGDSKFFEDALHLMNVNLVALVMLAGLEISLPLLRSVLNSAPQSLSQVIDDHWMETSVCARLIKEAESRTRTADPEIQADFDVCTSYWLHEFPNLSERTRSIIVLSFSMLVNPLVTRPLRKIFCSDTNVKPEDTFDGKIIIIDLPVQDFRLAGKIAQLTWKYCFQIAVMRRTPPREPNAYLRPVFLWADEAQNFVTEFDSEYQAVARSSGGCTVYLTQNRESYLRVLGRPETVDSLLGNLQAKFFCQNSGDTNRWASELFGDRYVRVTSTNVGHTGAENRNETSGVTRSEQKRPFVEPSVFATLRRGGALNNFLVDAVCYLGGHRFPDPSGNESSLPYKFLSFNQTT